MLKCAAGKSLPMGEAMAEVASVGDGLYRRPFAGDTFNSAWQLGQVIGPQATVGFVTRIGQDRLTISFVAELAADSIDTNGISRAIRRTMWLPLRTRSG